MGTGTLLVIAECHSDKLVDELWLSGAELAGPAFEEHQFVDFLIRAQPHSAAARAVEVAAEVLGLRWKLTRQQTTVLALVCKGESRDEIASKLRIGNETLKKHVGGILERAGCTSVSCAITIVLTFALQGSDAVFGTFLTCCPKQHTSRSKLLVLRSATSSPSEVKSHRRLETVNATFSDSTCTDGLNEFAGIVVFAKAVEDGVLHLIQRLLKVRNLPAVLFALRGEVPQEIVNAMHKAEFMLGKADNLDSTSSFVASIFASLPVANGALRPTLSRIAYEWLLTPQQMQVLSTLLATRGDRNELSRQMHISEATVKSHLQSIRRAGGMSTTAQLIAHVFLRAICARTEGPQLLLDLAEHDGDRNSEAITQERLSEVPR